jgi:hypothetical protein
VQLIQSVFKSKTIPPFDLIKVDNNYKKRAFEKGYICRKIELLYFEKSERKRERKKDRKKGR